MAAAQPGYSYAHSRILLIFKQYSNTSFSLVSIINIFHYTFWLLVIGILTVFGGLFMTLQDSGKTMETLVYLGRAMLCMSNENDFFLKNPNWNATVKIQLFFLSLFGGLIFWTYSGCLISFLAVPQRYPPINHIKDLSIKSNFKLFIYNNTPVHNEIKRQVQNNELDLKEIYEDSIEPNLFTRHNIMQVLNTLATTNNAAALVDEIITVLSLQQQLNIPGMESCILTAIQYKDIPNPSIGWMYPKNSILANLFDHYMFEMEEKGILRKIVQDYLPPKKFTCQPYLFSGVSFSLVEILFIFLSLGIMTSLLIWTIELWKKYKGKVK